MIGRVFADRYKLVEFVGKGGMALVYRAVDMRTGHDVAVKILRPEYNQDAEFLGRFQREAMTASKMSHHNIVNLLDVGVDGDCRYLVMEYVRGKTLKDVIKEKGALPPNVTAQIAIRILSALQHAHKNGIIHRDIKPQNILVHSDGLIKVADFGIARVAGSGTISKGDTVMGSVHYFSPEQARGEEATEVSDLYSVGVVLYEMLTGRVPFDGDTPVAVAMQQISAAPTPMNKIKPDVPPAMQRVVSKAMAKKKEERYQSATEMAQDLQRAMQEPEGDWATRTQDAPIPLISQNSARQRPIKNAVMRSKHRRRVWVERGIVAVVSVVVLILLYEGAIGIYNTIVNSTSAPFLVGETEESAVRMAIRAGLKTDITRVSDEKISSGTVILQSPEFETNMKKGDTIFITVSTGPRQKEVPKLVGTSVDTATTTLEKMGIKLLVVSKVLSQEPAGTVLQQTPESGQLLEDGEIVQVTVSGGCITVKSYVGMQRDEALRAVEQSGLILSEIQEIIISDESLAGRVAAQNPLADEQVMEGETLVLAIYQTASDVEAQTESGSTIE